MLDSLLDPDSVIDRMAAPQGFVCSFTGDGDATGWVHLAGELDIATTPRLVLTLGRPQLQTRLLVLDLRALDFIDTCGVHAIVLASRRAREAGRRLIVLRGPPRVARMFVLTGYADAVEIADLDPRLPAVQVLLQLGEQDRTR